jgi:hypothetical protein
MCLFIYFSFLRNETQQLKFYSLPKRYNKIQSFEQRPTKGLNSDEGPLLETSNLFVSFRYIVSRTFAAF